MKEAITHSMLCQEGAKYMKKRGIVKYQIPSYVVVEIVTIACNEPDVFGFGSCASQQIEVKVSRSDFLADKKKPHRIFPESDIGRFRSYLCPDGLILPNELPNHWGLLYFKDGVISVIKEPEYQESWSQGEQCIICSVMRRLGIKNKIYSFRNTTIKQ